MSLVIGIDFDNTIVCYDEVFHLVACEKKIIPHTLDKNKECVRNYLRQEGRESEWTELQGYVYGTRMRDASAYPGVIDFLKCAIAKGVLLYIISHKTLYPYRGPQYNLHNAAYDWLEYNNIFNENHVGLKPEFVFFEQAIEDKLKKINNKQCSYFIDDLPELFSRTDFPNNAKKILFKPNATDESIPQDCLIFKSWLDINDYLLKKI